MVASRRKVGRAWVWAWGFGLALLAVVAAALPAVAVTMRYTHFQPGTLDQPKQAAALAFKYYVETNTNGEVRVEVFPAGQLGDALPVLEQLRLGSIQLAVVHDGPIASVFPPMQVFNVPYLFNDQPEAWAAFDSDFTRRLGEEMRRATGIRLMALADNGLRHFTNSRRPVRSLADIRGLKIRVQPGPLYEILVRSLGASASPIPWLELPSALQQGVVDGQENGVTNILAASLYRFNRYVTLDGHVYSYHAYLMNDAFYSRLTPGQRRVVDRGIEIAKWIHRGMTSAQDLNAETILKNVGMEVTPLSPNQLAAFRQATQPAVVDWLRGEVGEQWVQGVLDAVERYRASQGGRG